MLSTTKKIINKLTLGLKTKKLFIKITYSKQSIKFTKFLLKYNFIYGFEKFDKIIIIFLKYNCNNIASIQNLSYTYQKTVVKPKVFKRNYIEKFKIFFFR